MDCVSSKQNSHPVRPDTDQPGCRQAVSCTSGHEGCAPCRVPNLKIIPASYSESKGTTAVFSRYLATDPGWTLGSAAQLPWPRCVQHVRTPDGIDSAVARAPGAIA